MLFIRHSNFVIDSTFGLRHSSFKYLLLANPKSPLCQEGDKFDPQGRFDNTPPIYWGKPESPQINASRRDAMKINNRSKEPPAPATAYREP